MITQPFESGPSARIRGVFSMFRNNGIDTNRVRTSSESTPPPSSPGSASSTPSRSRSRTPLNGSSYGKLVETLGCGISAKVELYYHKSSGQLYAIKTFKPRESYETKTEYSKRCRMEYDVLWGLSHPNVLQMIDFVHGFQTTQIVMEYAPYTLLKLIQVTKPSEEELGCFFRQICEGLSYLHGYGIAHRDLKMENVVIGDCAVVKLIDFGTAFQFGRNENLLASGAVGTEALISPEASSSITYDAGANDVWGVAVLFYSMLHLDFPWRAAVKSDPQFMAFMHDSTVLNDEIPDEYRVLLTRALEVDPVKRITMRGLLDDLSAVVPHHSECEKKTHRRTNKMCRTKLDKVLS